MQVSMAVALALLLAAEVVRITHVLPAVAKTLQVRTAQLVNVITLSGQGNDLKATSRQSTTVWRKPNTRGIPYCAASTAGVHVTLHG